jgi:hypothetical protein
MVHFGSLGWSGQLVEFASMREIGANEPCESEWTFDGCLGRLGQAQQQIGDQGDGDLDVHGILVASREVANFQGLFDRSEEQFDGQRRLERSAICCAVMVRSFERIRRIGPVSSLMQTSRMGLSNGYLRLLICCAGNIPTRSERIARPVATDCSCSTSSGVLLLNRVTIRRPPHSTRPIRHCRNSQDQRRR